MSTYLIEGKKEDLKETKSSRKEKRKLIID